MLNASADNGSACVSLSDEEFAGLVALDGSWQQRRPSSALELRLRQMDLIEPSRLSRLPVRTAKGEALVLANQPPDEEIERQTYVLPSNLLHSIAA